MTIFKKFPSIVQYSGVVKQVRDHCKYHSLPLPTIKFSGSVKIHGSNGGIGFTPDGEMWFQSRERVLSYESDNAGFCLWGEANKDAFKTIFNKIVETEGTHTFGQFYIFGEWFGPSIHKGVAVNQLPEKKFGIFEMVFVDGENKFNIDPRRYNDIINTLLPNTFVVDSIVPAIELEIDFNDPSAVQNFLSVDAVSIGDECPIGKYFGVSGIGEGRVWTANVDWLPKFKVKDERHSVTKVTTIRELSAAEIASKKSAEEFVEFVCTENRLEQGISKLGEMGLTVDIKNMGTFLRWVFNDIMEEQKDVLVNSMIDKRDVSPKIADKARNWFLNYINKEMGIV